MKKALIFVLVILLLTSCKSGDSVSQTEKPSSDIDNGEWIVKQNETELTLAVYSVDTFQPIATKSTSVTDAMSLVYEPLFRLNGTLKPVGALASGYSVSSDGMTIEITLNSNAKWHDNTKFSASDVDYTVKSIMNSDSVYKSYLQNVVSCSASGSSKYIFRLSRPVPNFIANLTFPIIKSGTSMEINADYIPIGTGPYKYGGKIGSKLINLVQNENWHGGSVGIKSIRLDVLKDKETAISAFEANEVSCITSKTVDLNQYTPRGKVSTKDYVSNNMVYLGINFYKQVLWGTGTRQALGYIINKDELTEKQMYGRAVAVDVPINPSAWYYEAESKSYHYDKDAANALLIQDGWNKGEWGYSRIINGTDTPLKLQILVNGENEEKVNIANAVAKYLNDSEIAAEVKAVPYEEYKSLIERKEFDLFIGETVMPNCMDSTFLVGSGGNYFTYSSSDMDLKIANIGKAPSEDATKIAVSEFDKLFNTDIPFIPLFFKKESLIFNNTLAGNVEPNFSNVYGGITEWYIEQK